MQQAVTSRIKIMGRLDIAERHVPQDGRATVHFGGEPLDLRVAVLPTRDGEHVVLRLAARADRQRGIADLGMDEQSLSAFTRAIRQPFGAIVVCGPTGSGKTTTLYAALAELNDPGRMLATIEDPIEHRLPRVNQVEVNSRRGVTFARGLRTMLRSDPDVILVGEIRDEETAEIAVQAAMTGHLLLTSLHAPTAAGAIERLRDMGIDPRRLASSLNCIVAQRLARRLCDACKEPHETPAGELYQANGCSACAGTGYRGRVALHEVLPVQGPIRKLVAEGSEKLFAEAVKQRMTTLREAGLRLCREGVCSLDELERVTGGRLV